MPIYKTAEDKKQTIADLKAARKLLSKGWCRGTDKEVSPNTKKVCYCMRGAVAEVTVGNAYMWNPHAVSGNYFGSRQERAYYFLVQALPASSSSIAEVNDNLYRGKSGKRLKRRMSEPQKKAQMLEIFNRAIKAAQAAHVAPTHAPPAADMIPALVPEPPGQSTDGY